MPDSAGAFVPDVRAQRSQLGPLPRCLPPSTRLSPLLRLGLLQALSAAFCVSSSSALKLDSPSGFAHGLSRPSDVIYRFSVCESVLCLDPKS